MSNIDLKEIIKRYPDILNNKTKLSGMLKDIAPENVLEINLIIQSFEIGIQKQIAKNEHVTNADVHKYIKMMEENFGTAQQYAYQVINIWCIVYNKNCPRLEFSKTKVKRRDTVKPYEKGIIYEDSNVCVIYQGWKDVLYSNTGKTKVLKFIFENKTDKRAKFQFINTEIEGYVNLEHTLSYELDKKKKGQQEFNFIYENKIPDGIDKYKSIECRLSYQLLDEDMDVPFPPHYEVAYRYESDEISIAI